MPVTNVKSGWEDGNLVFRDKDNDVLATFDGTARALLPAVVADDNLTPGIPVIHRLSIANQATGDVEYTITHKIRVIDAWCVKEAADGHATEDTITVSNDATAITDAMAIGANNDTSITRAATINDASQTIDAGGTLTIEVVRGTGGGNDTQCQVYVMGLLVD